MGPTGSGAEAPVTPTDDRAGGDRVFAAFAFRFHSHANHRGRDPRSDRAPEQGGDGGIVEGANPVSDLKERARELSLRQTSRPAAMSTAATSCNDALGLSTERDTRGPVILEPEAEHVPIGIPNGPRRRPTSPRW